MPDSDTIATRGPRGLGAQFAAWRESTLTPFQTIAFRNIWIAVVVSNFGAMIQTVGAAWMMTSLAPSADMVALVQTASTLPIVLLAMVAGALADILDRRAIMLFSQISVCAVSLLLALLTYLGVLGPWMLLGFTFLIGAGGALMWPAWGASLGEIVPREQVPAAASLNALAFNVARSAGPALGGVAVALGGAALAFFINGVSYLGLIAVLFLWKSPKPDRTMRPEPLGRAIVSGLRYIFLSYVIGSAILRTLLFSLSAVALLALLPVIAREGGGGPAAFGGLLGAFGVGAMVGALTSARLRAVFSVNHILAASTLIMAAALAVIATRELQPVQGPMLFVAGIAYVTALSGIGIVVQMSSPRWVLGRTLAAQLMSVTLGMALGAAIWGVVAREAGVSAALYAAAIFAFVSLLAGRLWPLPRETAGDLEPIGRLPSLEVGQPIDPRAGPVVTVVEYRVPLANGDAFLEAAHAFGRTRRRDGARGWSLAQDVADPTRWVERYHSPTWEDNLRRLGRPTMADEEARVQLWALLEGHEPAVRRFLERPPGSAVIGGAAHTSSSHAMDPSISSGS